MPFASRVVFKIVARGPRTELPNDTKRTNDTKTAMRDALALAAVEFRFIRVIRQFKIVVARAR
jgi:hypothetical protein